MALIVCRECAAKISSQAESCPQCGAKQKKKTSLLRGFIYFVISIPVFLFFYQCSRPNVPSQSALQAEKPVVQQPSVAPTVAPAARHDVWTYESGKDKMRDADWRIALVTSTSDLTLDFPYNKTPNKAHIIIRSDPKFGKDIYLTVDHGQFDCDIYACRLSIKYDAGPIRQVIANRAGAGNSDTVFLPFASTLAQLKKAKRATIEATFFGSGVRQMEFELAGLEWR